VNRPIQTFALAILLTGLTAAGAQADLTISGGNVSWESGTGTMDITISSNNSDTLSAFNLELLITPVVGMSSSIPEFSPTQSDPYSSSSYVFAGDSFGQNYGLPVWGPAFTTGNSNDTITGGDSADSSGAGYVTVAAMGTGPASYLATVQFQPSVGGSPTDQWNISLVAALGSTLGQNTFFQDSQGNYFNATSIGPGVTVTFDTPGESGVLGTFGTPGQMSVAPEPTSAITSVTGAFCFAAYGWLRRRRSHRRAA
jgi:hypothetical protein